MKKLKNFFKIFGPGFITGASDDDPSGVATCAQAGARFGYSLLWMPLFIVPFMIAIQEMCGRIGLVKGRGLGAVIKKRYGKRILLPIVGLLLIANIINIGANLGAMAASIRLIIDLPFAVVIIGMTLITIFLEVFVSYKNYAKYLTFLALSLFAYVAVVFMIKQDWSQIAYSTFIPHFQNSDDYLMSIVALLGTTISPYLFFWQASEEVEEEVETKKIKNMGVGKPLINDTDIRRMRIDTVIGMLFSNLIMFFIIITAASTLFRNGIFNIETAEQAALALQPLGGELALTLFVFGIIGIGLLSVPILAGSASYAVTELLGWKSGLYRKFKAAHGFYAVIAIATLLGLLVNFSGIKSFTMLFYSAVVNGLVSPFLMIVIVLLAADKKTMGKFTSSKLLNILGWTITVIMSLAAIMLIWGWLN
ncbi:TPA: iron transporter [Candidatus Uhrbacteria bacterium]|nr:iron transporter [Candidatus Uhrbacteria bacterium]